MNILLSILLALNLARPLKIPGEDYRVLILFDLSGSMTAPGMVFAAGLHDQWTGEVNRALTKFGKSLSASDHVCLGTVASKILIASQCSDGGPADLVTPFRSLDQGGSPSPINSAVWSGVEKMIRTKPVGTKDLIIVVTDGMTSGNEHSTSEVSAFALRSAVVVHTVLTRPAMWATTSGATMSRAFDLMKQLAEQTGGTSIECSRSDSRFDCQKPAGGLAAVFSKILDDTRSKGK